MEILHKLNCGRKRKVWKSSRNRNVEEKETRGNLPKIEMWKKEKSGLLPQTEMWKEKKCVKIFHKQKCGR